MQSTTKASIGHISSGPASLNILMWRLDDEFEGVLDSRWGWINQGSSTATTLGGKLLLRGSSGATSGLVMDVSQLVGDWAFTFLTTTGPYANSGPMVYNTLNTKGLVVSNGLLTTYINQQVGNVTVASPTSGNYWGLSPRYTKLARVGGNFIVSTSIDNVVWVQRWVESIASRLIAIDLIGFHISNLLDLGLYGPLDVDWIKKV